MEKLTKEQLYQIRAYLVNEIFQDSSVVFDQGITSNDNGHDIYLLDVIASLYEMLNREVEGEPYEYMFHWYNKVTATTDIDDQIFIRLINGGDPYAYQ